MLIYQDANGSETFHEIRRRRRPADRRADLPAPGQADSFAGDPIFAHARLNPIPTNGSTWPSWNGTNIENFQYDGLSRMTYAFDNNDPTTTADDSTVTDAYDSLGRVIERPQSLGGAAARPGRLRRLLAGRRPPGALTYPNGRTDTYTYDKLDRLKTVSDQGSATPIARVRLHRRWTACSTCSTRRPGPGRRP